MVLVVLVFFQRPNRPVTLDPSGKQYRNAKQGLDWLYAGRLAEEKELAASCFLAPVRCVNIRCVRLPLQPALKDQEAAFVAQSERTGKADDKGQGRLCRRYGQNASLDPAGVRRTCVVNSAGKLFP